MTPQDRNIAQALARVRNPLTAIRAFCVTCMGGYVAMVLDCTAPKCPLFVYRMGKNPRGKARGKTFQPIDSGAFCSANSEADKDSREDLKSGEVVP